MKHEIRSASRSESFCFTEMTVSKVLQAILPGTYHRYGTFEDGRSHGQNLVPPNHKFGMDFHIIPHLHNLPTALTIPNVQEVLFPLSISSGHCRAKLVHCYRRRPRNSNFLAQTC